MTKSIPKEEWKSFCDSISRDKLDWQTNVQVLSSDYGAQMLSEGLPLIGLVFDVEENREKIELITGTGGGIHQTHSIFEPSKMLFQTDDQTPGGTLDIEDNTGTKTLVTFTNSARLPATQQKGSMALL